MHDFTVAGHLCVDLTPCLPGTAVTEPGILSEVGPVGIALGGATANTGAGLAELGASVRISAAIGDDPLGGLARAEFARRGLSAQGLQVAPAAGTSYSVILQPPGDDRTIWHHPGANAAFDPALVDLAGTRMLHFGYPSLMDGMVAADGGPLVDLFTRARRCGVSTSLDTAVIDPRSSAARRDWSRIFARLLPHVDVFTPSIDDLTSAFGDARARSRTTVERYADRLIGAGAAIVMISAGAEGMFLRTASASVLEKRGETVAALAPSWSDAAFWQRADPIDTLATTNGAGDAATAGLLLGVASGASVGEAAQMAATCAATRISGRRLDSTLFPATTL
ncbi:PfkB family carbohydrate kinase [Microbacterium sp.]|uniref:carbohydrate kinase family protein n=1 Tax=Microbacterium sp. TaxID=51671 RepID=UPI00333FB6EA